MSDLDERIAGLPEWPDPYEHSDRLTAEFTIDAALARLALAREWIALQRHGCPDRLCTCGRDALLAAMEVPK